jgi:hypothetical protein
VYFGFEGVSAARPREWLAEKGYDPAYGARPLKRTIQKSVQDPLAELILSGRIKDGEKVKIDDISLDSRLRGNERIFSATRRSISGSRTRIDAADRWPRLLQNQFQCQRNICEQFCSVIDGGEFY